MAVTKNIKVSEIMWDFDADYDEDHIREDEDSLYDEYMFTLEVNEDEDDIDSLAMGYVSDLTGWCIQDCKVEIS